MSHDGLHEAAGWAASMLQRVDGPGGILGQIQAGDWDQNLTRAEADDLAERLRAMAEHVRDTRARAHQHAASDADLAPSPATAAAGLPLNSKERYYTGTVLPMLIASDGFAHINRFLRLCGLEVSVPAGRDGDQELTFYTEYGFADSVLTDEDRARWPDSGISDTPDLVLAGPDWLLAIEAKMFHSPSADDLTAQMRRQHAVVARWAAGLQLSPERVRHVLLLPDRLHRRVAAQLRHDVVTWEQVLGEYWTVAPRYWSRILHTELRRHGELEARPRTSRRNATAMMTGAAIVEAHAAGTLPPLDHVGRAGGRHGTRFTTDLTTGGWRTTRYEVRSGPLPSNRNWFSIAEFVTATANHQRAEAESLPPAGGQLRAAASLTLAELVERVANGEACYEEAVEFFSLHSLARTAEPPPRGGDELWRRSIEDPDTEIVPGSWDEVSLAYVAGRLNDDQYRMLLEAFDHARTSRERR